MLVLVPILAQRGGRAGFLLLSCLAGLGALALAGLVLFNLAALGQGGFRAAARRLRLSAGGENQPPVGGSKPATLR
jgi:hypothetical protein